MPLRCSAGEDEVEPVLPVDSLATSASRADCRAAQKLLCVGISMIVAIVAFVLMSQSASKLKQARSSGLLTLPGRPGYGNACTGKGDRECVPIVNSTADYKVCKEGLCQSGLPGSSCEVTDDCTPPCNKHGCLKAGNCWKGKCQSGLPGASCSTAAACLPPCDANGCLPAGVCHEGLCQTGLPGASCGDQLDCLTMPGLSRGACVEDIHRSANCRDGRAGAPCNWIEDCAHEGVCIKSAKRKDDSVLPYRYCIPVT
eukprot:TRINITY_DN58395_c0_g1_i1.p1 TRINITY_DN58395_c0_g1~~TRINITY_DN58395_c0_g1_i1.p1  ORF type:complete len:256 (-),score=21.52 TRINITY_DN58395_c0_g1_i1:101-868(-)